MKINYIITGKVTDVMHPDTSNFSIDTVKAIEVNKATDDTVTNVFFDDTLTIEEALNKYFETIDNTVTHVCIIPDGTTLLPEYSNIVKEYFQENKIIMPIVELNKKDTNADEVFRGFLNTCIWKPFFSENLGILDHKLAVRQVDLLLYTCLIPIAIVKENKFKTKLKYFSFFEYFNRITNKELGVIGIPKVLARTTYDYELKEVNKEDKLKYFKAAQETFKSEEDIII